MKALATGGSFERSGGFGEIEAMYTQTVIDLKAKIIVELGTCLGFSTDAFLKGLRITDGILYSVDLHPESEETASTIARLKDEPRFKFIANDSIEVGKTWNRGGIDILLCDSDHAKLHVLAELEIWSRFNPKIIFVHDMWEHGKEGPPYYACLEFAAKYGKPFEIRGIREGPGVGIIKWQNVSVECKVVYSHA